MMNVIQLNSFGIANNNVNSGHFFPSFCFHLDELIGELVDLLCSLSRYHFHFDVFATPPSSAIPSFGSLILSCHNQHMRLEGCRKVVLVIPSKQIPLDLLHYKPNQFFPFVAQLPLYPLDRKPFFGGSCQLHGQNSISDREIRGFRNGAAHHHGSVTAGFTLMMCNTFHPVLDLPLTDASDNTSFLPLLSRRILAGLFARESFEKGYKFHNHYFDLKLIPESVTHLGYV